MKRPRIHSIAIATWLLAIGGIAIPPANRAQSSLKANVSEAVEIDVNAPSHPFPHFWEKMFGSGRAILSLRESYRNDLRTVKRITNFVRALSRHLS